MTAWHLVPHVIVRTTGFSFDLIERLRQPRSAIAARRHRELSQALEDYVSSSPRVRRPARPVVSALKNRRRVELDEAGEYVQWNALVDAVTAANRELDSALELETAEATQQLHSMCDDARFAEAIAISCPPVYRSLRGEDWTSRLERQVASFVQRFCGKNETVSFFGPINYGRIEPANADGVTMTWSGPVHLAARRTHVAYWVVRGLVASITAEPEIASWLVPRRRGFLTMPSGRGEDPLARLLACCDGHKRSGMLAKDLGVTVEELAPILRLGYERKLLVHQLDVPAAIIDPLANLIERLAGIPGVAPRAWIRRVLQMRTEMEAFGPADAAGKVELGNRYGEQLSAELGIHNLPPTSTSTARGESQHFYVDRLPLREECVGDLNLEIGGARAAEITTRMEPLLEVLSASALRRQQLARRRIAELLGKTRMPLWKVVMTRHEPPVEEIEAAQAIALAITDPSVPEVDLDAATLPCLPSSEGQPLACSIDILVAARSLDAWHRGEYRLVAGDVHDTTLVWGWSLQFHRDRQMVEAEVTAALGLMPRPHVIATTLSSRRTGLIPSEFPGPVIELGSVSKKESPWQLPFDDLFVESDGTAVKLVSNRLAAEVYLYNGELDTLVHTAFAIPRVRPIRVDLGAHTPRISINGVVIQRRQWRPTEAAVKTLADATTDRARLMAALAIWDPLGMPRFVFAKFANERKPIMVDVESPLLLRVFTNLAKTRGDLVVSEMLPGRDDLWLRSELGAHTAELRCAFVRRGRMDT